MVGYVWVVVTVGWLVVMIGGLGRECGVWDDEEGGSFPGYSWCGLWWLSSRYFSRSFFARFLNLVTHTLVHYLHFSPVILVFQLAFYVIDLLSD